MAKQRGRKSQEVDTPLASALRFIALAQDEQGEDERDYHCRFAGGEVLASDGVLSAGFPYEGEITLIPNVFRLRDAIERAGGAYSLTELPDARQIAIRGDKARFLVPCLAKGATLDYSFADPRIYALDDRFREAAAVASIWSTPGAEKMLFAAIVTNGANLVGTNGRALMEVWHGNDMPDMLIPVTFVKALNKITTPIAGYGANFDPFLNNTASTLTIHFEDSSWLKTRLYGLEDAPGNLPTLLAEMDRADLQPIPEGFFDGVKTIDGFSDDENPIVHIRDGVISSYRDDTKGARYDVPGIVGGTRLNAKQLMKLAAYSTVGDLHVKDSPHAVLAGSSEKIQWRCMITGYKS